MGLPSQGRVSAGVDGLTAGSVLSSVCLCVCTYIQQMKTDLISPAFPPQPHPLDPDILNGIYMSEALNAVFVENFQRDPTQTWQYFGSSTGFFRIYPGEDSGRHLHSPPGSVSGNKVTLQPNEHTFK